VPAGLPLTFAVTTGVCTLAPTDLANSALSGVITFTRESSNTVRFNPEMNFFFLQSQTDSRPPNAHFPCRSKSWPT
jgi:hypothetical protein